MLHIFLYVWSRARASVRPDFSGATVGVGLMISNLRHNCANELSYGAVAGEIMMSVARTTEISSTSTKSFEDAI